MPQFVSDDFLKERLTGIGGSDAAALCGKSPFSSPQRVYMDKMGLGEPVEMNMAMEAGHRLEPVVAEWFLDQMRAEGHEIRLAESTEMLRHPKHNFMIAHPDRMILNGGTDSIGGLEVKTTNSRFAHLWGEPGSDQVPEAYNIQTQHYMAVTDKPWWYLACLIGGNDLRIHKIIRNDRLIDGLIRIESKFWAENVMAENPPEIDGSKGSKELLKAMFPEDDGEEMIATPEQCDAVERLLKVKEDLKKAEGLKMASDNEVKALMKKAATLIGPGFRVTHKKTKDGVKVNWEAVARGCGAGQGLIDSHTKPKAGHRMFLPKRVEEK